MLSEIVIEPLPETELLGPKRHGIEESAACVATNDAVADSCFGLVTVEAPVQVPGENAATHRCHSVVGEPVV